MDKYDLNSAGGLWTGKSKNDTYLVSKTITL